MSDDVSHARNGLENAVFALGLLLVGGLVGVLAYEAVQRPAGPPALRVELGTPSVGTVPVTVYNDGAAVAEAVRVEVCAGTTCGEAELEAVPPRTSRSAVVAVAGDSLAARVVSYLTP